MNIITPIDPANLVQAGREITGKSRDLINEVPEGTKTFADFITDAVRSVDQAQKTAELKTQDLITGQSENVHDVMIAMERARVSFSMMTEIRNRVVEAYKELSRMPI